jgi:hypothetical protein
VTNFNYRQLLLPGPATTADATILSRDIMLI